MVELALRLVFSLAVVIGMVMVLAKLSSKRFRGSSDALVRVLHRQPLSRGSAVSVVTVGARVLVLGTTEQRVELLAELDPEELELEVDEVLTSAATPVPATAGDVFAPALEAALRREVPTGPGGRHAALRSRRTRPSRPTAVRVPTAASSGSVLAGSVLSPQTWKQALAAVTRKGHAPAKLNASELGAS